MEENEYLTIDLEKARTYYENQYQFAIESGFFTEEEKSFNEYMSDMEKSLKSDCSKIQSNLERSQNIINFNIHSSALITLMRIGCISGLFLGDQNNLLLSTEIAAASISLSNFFQSNRLIAAALSSPLFADCENYEQHGKKEIVFYGAWELLTKYAIPGYVLYNTLPGQELAVTLAILGNVGGKYIGHHLRKQRIKLMNRVDDQQMIYDSLLKYSLVLSQICEDSETKKKKL